MTATATDALAGWRVLVTRPAAQAEALCERLAAAGAEPIRFPVMAICTAEPGPVQLQLERLADYDYALFVSANAVAGFRELAGDSPWPRQVCTLAIGRRTAAAMEAAGIPVDLQAPSPYTSEALLGLADLQSLPDCSIVIFRGRGGRELIAQTLTARGARVEYADVYERVLPDTDPAPLLARWRSDGVDAVMVTSNAILDNLLQLLGEAGMALLQDTPLIVPGQRAREHARTRGCQRIRVAGDATDEAMMAALMELAAAAD